MPDNRVKTGSDFSSGGRNAETILIVCSLLYIVNYMDRQVLSVVLQPMKTDLGLTDGQAGMLQTTFFLSMAILAFPVSFLVDRWSRRKAVGIMAIIWSVATYITGMGNSFLGVLSPRILVGAGEAGFSAGGTAWITAAYPLRSRGKALGVFNIAISVGAALGAALGGYLCTHCGGWRTPFFVFAIPGIILGVIAFFLPDYKTIKSTKGASSRSVIADTLSLWRIPSLKWLFIGFGMHNIMAFSLLVWTPALLMRSLNISASKAGLFMGISGIVSIFGALWGGWLADSWQRRNPHGRMLLAAVSDPLAAITSILALMLVHSSGTSVLISNPYLLASVIFGCLYGVCAMLGLPALGAVTQDVVHPRLKGISWGMTMFSMYILGGAWGPALVGTLSGKMGSGALGLHTALISAAATGLLSGLCFWAGSRHYPKDVAKVESYRIESEK